jgi:hypoxanthine phosphoribosyltransferase
MKSEEVKDEITNVLFTEAQIQKRLQEPAQEVEDHYQGQDLLLVGVLKGAVVVMADFIRHLKRHAEMDWMAVSSYGSGTKSSGVVRIIKDLDQDVVNRNVLVIEDIIDSGLTLSWLVSNLRSRGARNVEVLTLLRKPDAAKVAVNVKFVGFDIPNDFVVGYGLDFAEKYRNLRDVAVLSPKMYS